MNQVVSRQRLRLAFVTGGLKLGGTTTFLCNIAGELLRRQMAAEVFSFEADHPMAVDFQRLQIPVTTHDDRQWIYEDRLRKVLHDLKCFQPTHVIANLGPASFEVLRYVPAGVGRIAMVQSDDDGWYRSLRPYHVCMDLIGAVSRNIETRLRTFPEFGKTSVAYLPYGVPMPERLPIRAVDPNRPLRILYLGRLDQEQKRVRLFPGMLRQLQEAGIPFHWTIAGNGPEKAALEGAMTSSNPEQTLSFPGPITYEHVPAVLAEHDVFLLASDYEGLPLSLLEAMGQGLVPVVSDLPSGIREVVDDSTGLRISPQDTAGYMKAIIELHQDRPRVARLSQAARQKVRADFSIAAMTDRWLQALPEISQPTASWPDQVKVKPILCAPNPWIFSPPARWLRRTLIKFRKRA